MITAILQARMSSTRLPGKAIRKILGRPMLSLHLDRVRRSERIDRIVVATSDDVSDNPIEALCRELQIDCYRGSLNDVLDRYFRAWQTYGGDPVVRLTGDCPLADPDLIDRVIGHHLAEGNDYTCNVRPQTFPDGLDVEVFTPSVLQRAHAEARLPSQREHVTFYFTDNPDAFKLGSLNGDQDLSDLRWTVDYPEDFELVRQIYESLYPINPEFRTNDILALLRQRPELSALNSGHKPGEGWVDAFERDKEILKMADEE